MSIDMPVAAPVARHDPLPRSLRVLAVGINYGPEHTGIAPYTTGLCEHLAARGMSVSVFTGVPHYPSWTVDPRDRFRIRRTERIRGLEVRRLRHHVPRRQSALRRAAYELSFGAQVATQRPSERPDVVLAIVPSLFGAMAAARIARRAGAPLVVWVQDLMGRAAAQSGMSGGSAVAGAVDAVERSLLRRADRVVVLNERFREHALAVGVPAERLAVQPNWTHLPPASPTDRARTRARLGWSEDETVVLHSGNMGLKQGLQNVVEAARLADVQGRRDVRFVLMGDGNQRDMLTVRATGIAAIDLRPPTTDYPAVLAAADVLLVNERLSNVDMCLPSKLTSYLHAGRPVIAASPAEGGTAAEVRRSGAGLVVPPGDPSALLEAVRDLAADPELMATFGRAGKAYAAMNLAADRARDSLADVLRQATAAHRA
jgi:colanic acid biosynthesis glycosyl transferase WcaI